ncbi:Canalicular multispecific organic anion transporter 2 [Linderina macrospora]|uniref:Canalicular multispecific organic anion transporter 2 n=1 Tax=Linderina macrospora TaxID=4868 RepID=A0ACC1J6Q4_9FUNG|nr:Canalicular multispecific organic anion transporter 2 [Linderina macrospora]
MIVQSQCTDYKLTSGELKVFESLINSMVSSMSRLVGLRTRVVECLDCVDVFRLFTQTPCETAWEEGGAQPPANWPSQGEIEFRNYSMRYGPEHDLSLKNISLKIRSGERIGIVRRTGAGKSLLTRALFRLVEGDSGSILIDGVDIAALRADGLRSNLSIIPQDPTIFNGSVKANLDPLQQYSIEDMWAALIKADMVDVVNPKRLHDKTKKDSQDEDYTDRYMFSLARALLCKRNILVLDEATADVDLKTDKVVHDAIHKEFARCTILTIAHRLETVMNSDRIIVMDHGTIAEFDTPDNLRKSGGLFAELIKSNDFANM